MISLPSSPKHYTIFTIGVRESLSPRKFVPAKLCTLKVITKLIHHYFLWEGDVGNHREGIGFKPGSGTTILNFVFVLTLKIFQRRQWLRATKHARRLEKNPPLRRGQRPEAESTGRGNVANKKK